MVEKQQRFNTVRIHEPIYRYQICGIAQFRFKGYAGVDVTFDDEPFKIYRIKTEDALACPTQVVGRNVLLRLIPLSKFEVRENHDYEYPGCKK